MSTSSVILLCPSCRTQNRVPADRLGDRPRCGMCGTALEYPSSPVEVTEASFDREAGDWTEALFIEFKSRTCGYCAMVEPVVQDLARWRAGRLKVITVDIERELLLARRFSVMATPTFLLLRNGRQLARIDGAPREKIDLVRWVDQHLGSAG